jgi:hypothetical protein
MSKLDDEIKLEELKEKYRNLAHAVQSGVAYTMEAIDPKQVEPKHLRVGVNLALIDCGALALTLFRKGVVTELEYYTTLVELTQAEVIKYQDMLQHHYGRPVTLM